MKFMILLKATKDTEAGVMPSQELLTAMMKFNQELVAAGVMVAGEGLQSSAKGARVNFDGEARAVVEGPFPETEHLLAGFWIFNVASKQEAIDWVKRCPNPTGDKAVIEIRQIFEMADFGDAATPELRATEAKMRAEAEKK